MPALPAPHRLAPLVLLTLALGCGDDGSSDDGPAATSSATTAATSTDSTGQPPDESTGQPPGTTGGTTAADEGTTNGGVSGDETSIPAVAFDEVLALIGDECFCHRSAPPAGGLDMTDANAYANLVSVPSNAVPAVNRITPGDPSQSYLYLKITGEHESVGGAGSRMPAGLPALPPEDIDLVRFWILGGAQP